MSVKTALQALAIARSSEADEAVLAVYLHELADLDRQLVMLACERLAKLPRREYQAALPWIVRIQAGVCSAAPGRQGTVDCATRN
ncbi:MAG: hypothetical protein ACO32I_08160 [Candidatus Limnocylindrus sp.]